MARLVEKACREDHSLAGRLRPVGNRTILDMITSGGPDRAQGRPVTVGKGVAKSACPATGPGPFLYSPGCDRPKPIAPGPSATSPPVTRSLPVPLPGRDGLVHGLVDAED